MQVPDRWEAYSKIGKVVKGTSFIPFKVPLTNNNKWNVTDLIEAIPSPGLGLVIDLTNTTRYYSEMEFTSREIKYKKIMTKGHTIPNSAVVEQFCTAVDEVLAKQEAKLIGVHCTHGLNRTGYLICRYMIQKLGMDPEVAIASFDEARGHKQERLNYIDDLKTKGWKESKDEHNNATNEACGGPESVIALGKLAHTCQDDLVLKSGLDQQVPYCPDTQPEVDEEQLRTLWVGSLHENVDEEILYELFQNAGPLESIKIPKDRETKKQRNFGFIIYQHECSVKYAYDLLNNTQLYGQKIRLQNKIIGLGMVNNFRNHSRSNTMPNLHMSNGGRRDDRRDRGREDSMGLGMEEPIGRIGRQEDIMRSGMMRQNSYGGRGFGMGGQMNYQAPYGYGASQMGQDSRNRRQGRERDYERELIRERSFERRGRDFDRRDDRRRQY